MLYELREYYVLPGRMPNMLARFRDHTSKIFDRIGIKNVGYWTEEVGYQNRLTYIIAFRDMADREHKWAIFREDPEWIAARDASEADGQIVEDVENRFLTPTDFSLLK